MTSLERILKEKKITDRQFCELIWDKFAVRFCTSTILALRHSERKPTLFTAYVIADALGLPVDVVFPREEIVGATKAGI